MNGRRVEFQHNTPEQVRAYLTEALAIVADLELSDDLRGLAFAKAVDLVAAKQITIEAIGMAAPAMAIPGRL